MVEALYIVTLLSSSIGGLVLVLGFGGAKSAPQEASAAALAIALAVIPYVFTRCVQISRDRKVTQRSADRAIELLQEIKSRD